jgi:hypothetical protein
MKNALKMKLIDGIFELSEMNEIILTMIDKKIQFHELNSFRNLVQHNQKDVKQQDRIEELKKERQLFIEYINSNINENFKINSEIKIQTL